jgi:CRISPR system Cascade subunit CasC
MFIQLHTLTSYPGTLLNRDDAGFAKQLPFGGTTRTRVSSQCLKYHWRHFDGEDAIRESAPMSVRSRNIFRLEVAKPLIEEEGLPAPLVYAGAMSLRALLLQETKLLDSNNRYLKSSSTKAFIEAGVKGDASILNTEQIIVLGRPEVEYVKQLIRDHVSDMEDAFDGPLVTYDGVPKEIVKEVHKRWKECFKSSSDLAKNLRALEAASGLDAAMFGRMVTSDVLARGDAAIHVAHAFTTHKAEIESDYFIAADDLLKGTGEQGAATIQTQELTSGLFYSYVVVDVPLLVSNIEGVERAAWTETERELAAEVMRRFVTMMATVSPGAKRGSTAPYAYAHSLFAEVGTAQPRTLANAFRDAVPRRDAVARSYARLGEHVRDMDGMYGTQTQRQLAAVGPADGLMEAVGVSERSSVPAIADWTADQIREA